MAFTYYLPKLTKEELKLVGRKDPIYLETFGLTDPDVDEIEMRMSESKSKFVEAVCVRRTLNCVLKPWFSTSIAPTFETVNNNKTKE